MLETMSSSPPNNNPIKVVFNGVQTQATRWFKHISEAAEAYKTREGKHRNKAAEPNVAADIDTAAAFVGGSVRDKEDTVSSEGTSGGDLLSPPRSSNGPETPSPCATPVPSGQTTPQPGSPATTASSKHTEASHRRSDGSECGDTHIACLTAESTLIEPSEVLVSQRDVLTAEPVLTPLEKLRRKDEVVKQALYEKQALVADILHVPREEFETIAELAGESEPNKEPSELVLAAVNQAHELLRIVNDSLHITEDEAVAATSEVGGTNPKSDRLPGVPAYKVQSIASMLNSYLTQLLNIMAAKDKERETLRRELQKAKEQVHALHERQDHNGPSFAPLPPVVQLDDSQTNSNIQSTISTETPTIVPPPTTPSEVFVDALSGEAETTLEAVQ